MMKQSGMKRSSSLPKYITCCADPDDSDIADDTEEDSCVTRERMHTSHLTDQQEIINFKLQFARQQEMLANLSLKLSKCAVEIDALKTENEVLIDERALPAVPPVRSKGWFSTSECRGSMQMLISVNAKYMTENSRLQVERDVLRASFHSYVKDSRRISAALQQENDALRHRLQDDDETDKKSFKELLLYPFDPFEKRKKSLSLVTSSTFPSDICHINDDDETQSECFQKWLQNQTQGLHVESNDGIQGDTKKRSGGARESQDLLVDFGETPRPMRTSISLSRSMPLTCRTSRDTTGMAPAGKMRWSFI
jgi:regulator of replication initiation timing